MSCTFIALSLTVWPMYLSVSHRQRDDAWVTTFTSRERNFGPIQTARKSPLANGWPTLLLIRNSGSTQSSQRHTVKLSVESEHDEPWLEWYQGDVYTKNPDEPTLGEDVRNREGVERKSPG